MNVIFSVVIANYNYGRFLEKALRSVVLQIGEGEDQVRPGEAEIIIIDGGSTDNSVEVIKKYAAGLPAGIERDSPSILRQKLSPTPISYWVSEPDRGQSDAFNKGFAKAKGQFLTWLNADDVLTRGALAAVKREIDRHPRCEWFIGSSLYTDENLKITKCFCAHRFSVLRARWGFLSAGGPSSFFTKRLLNVVGGVDVSLHYVMDTDLWYKFYLRAGARYRRTIHNIFAFRHHKSSKMGHIGQQITERVLENRRKAVAESHLLGERYGVRGKKACKIAQWLSVSLIDQLIAAWRNYKWRGKRATEI